MTAPETAPAERHMGEGLLPCPACGALPCDWTENPFASDDVPADAGDKCANCKGLIGDLAEGRDPEELCDTCYRDALAATPTALPSAEDALREAIERLAVGVSDKVILRLDINEDDPRLSNIIDELRADLTALQSPRASDEVLGEASGAGIHYDAAGQPTIQMPAEGWGVPAASPVPVDASGAIDSVARAMCISEGEDPDGSEGWKGRSPVINRYRRLAIIALHTPEISHTAPVADAQAGEGARECPNSPLPSGEHQVDTSMESGSNHCFFCEKPMPSSASQEPST